MSMTFLALTDVIVNMDDVVVIVPRWEMVPPPYGSPSRAAKKRGVGTAIYVRDKEQAIHSEVSYEEVLEQLKLALTAKQ